MMNYLTIDVEEWYQTVLLSGESKAFENTSLVENIESILFLLDKYNTKATFFIVGNLAEKYPETIRQIAKKGHEIASHGYSHRLVYKMSPEEFKNDVEKSLRILRKITNRDVDGFRASTWSINRNSPWAFDILESLGLKYDSSVYPFSLNLFNCLKLKTAPHEVGKNLYEFPPAVFNFMGWNFPFAGGTFMRLCPAQFIVQKVRQINASGNPAVIYFHSWEMNNKNFREPWVPKWKYFLQYANAGSVKYKIELLLRHFKFMPIIKSMQDFK